MDGGLHASETVGSQQLMEWVYQMVSRTDEETTRFLNDVIVLNVQANPDGQELVANWYMREKDPLKRSMNGLPRLYAKYVGHDDNRDFYMSNMKESTNMNRQLFLEWFPEIMYNHHQTGPAGAVVFIPPFRDPFNYNFDPRSEGIHQNEPPVVPRVVPRDHVQPPPARPRRRRGLHPALPRSVQLQLRSASAPGYRNGGHRHAQPPGGRG